MKEEISEPSRRLTEGGNNGDAIHLFGYKKVPSNSPEVPFKCGLPVYMEPPVGNVGRQNQYPRPVMAPDSKSLRIIYIAGQEIWCQTVTGRGIVLRAKVNCEGKKAWMLSCLGISHNWSCQPLIFHQHSRPPPYLYLPPREPWNAPAFTSKFKDTLLGFIKF